jgi:LmbE family N-acetylglucosaminyl deacetylase
MLLKNITAFTRVCLLVSLCGTCLPAPTLPSNEDRFKADLLLVVAHPDDETIAGSYLARAIFDEHKRVAVVFGTRGNSGGDQMGPQQAASLGAIREIEGRRALAYFGVTNVWFLDAPDTPGQDVLRSLQTWDHGRSLGRLVRYIRLTRPEVIVTWLPDYVAGENHGDHQAAGVLATEAFDIAGDPSAYGEQIAPPRDQYGIANLTEGLHPWQAKKLFYATDASHFEFLKGQGPTYSSTDISPSKKVSYERLAAEECAFHLTQSDSGYAAALALQKNDLTKTYLHLPVRLVFGKSHVDSSVTADVFAGVTPKRIAFHPAPAFTGEHPERPVVELGGPWYYYRQFWQAHNLEHLAKLVPPEILAGVSTQVTIPVLINNPSGSTLEGSLAAEFPANWELRAPAPSFRVQPGETYAASIVAVAPPKVDNSWRNVTISAQAGSRKLGSVSVRVQVGESSLPQ